MIRSINATLYRLEYPCCPRDPYPIALYTIKFSRTSDYYLHASLIPFILVTLLSFLFFFLGTEGSLGAERFNAGITLMLTTVFLQVRRKSHMIQRRPTR